MAVTKEQVETFANLVWGMESALRKLSDDTLAIQEIVNNTGEVPQETLTEIENFNKNLSLLNQSYKKVLNIVNY